MLFQLPNEALKLCVIFSNGQNLVSLTIKMCLPDLTILSPITTYLPNSTKNLKVKTKINEEAVLTFKFLVL